MPPMGTHALILLCGHAQRLNDQFFVRPQLFEASYL